MSQPDTNTQTSGARVEDERCLCREALDQLREFLGVSPTVRQHLTNSRLEFLKAIRAVIDERIEHMSSTAQRGTSVVVE